MCSSDLAERLDDLPGPVERADEIDHACHESQMECAQWSDAGHTIGTAVPAGQGNEEGDEGDPGEDRMSELREAENEEQARGNRETHMNDVMSVARAAHEMRDRLASASGRGVRG